MLSFNLVRNLYFEKKNVDCRNVYFFFGWRMGVIQTDTELPLWESPRNDWRTENAIYKNLQQVSE